MAQGYYGTANDPLASLHSERKVITPQTSGGSLEEGRYRLRTDLNSGDRIATYEINVGNGVEEVPVFPLSADADAEIQKYRQTYIPGEGWGFVPLLASGAAYPQLQFYHGGDATWYKWHDSLSAIPDSGLVHQWSLDAGSGTTATDSAGSKDGTINGATWTTTAKTGGQALSFDGTNDYVNGISSLTQFSAASIVAWVRPAAVGSGPYSPVMRGSTTAIDYGFTLVDNTTDGNYDDIRFLWRDGSFNDAFANDQFTVGTWAMVTITADSTNGFDGYIDKTSVASAASSSLTYSGNLLNIGRRPTDDRYFDGIIDEVLYYNRKLTASEVGQIYDATV